MSEIRKRLEKLGRPFVTLTEIARQGLQIEPSTLKFRIYKMAEADRPRTWVAGGSPMMLLDEAIKWTEAHEKAHSQHMEEVGLSHLDPAKRRAS